MGLLVLGVLVTAPHTECSLRADLIGVARGLGIDVEVVSGTGDAPRRAAGRLHVTVIGDPLRPAAVGAIASVIASCGANIDRVVRLSRQPVTSLELDVSRADPATLRAALAPDAYPAP